MTVTLINLSPEKTTQRVVLSNISWQTYESLLAEAGDKRASRFSYIIDALRVWVRQQLRSPDNEQ